jgi:hypothetical protein
MNPWIGVVLIGIGVSADVVLTLTHNQASSLVVSVVVAGIGVVQAIAHARSRANDGSTPPTPSKELTNGTGGMEQ